MGCVERCTGEGFEERLASLGTRRGPTRWSTSASGHGEDAGRSRASRNGDALGKDPADLVDVKSLGSIGEGGDGQRAHIERERRGGRARLVGGTCSGRRSQRLD